MMLPRISLPIVVMRAPPEIAGDARTQFSARLREPSTSHLIVDCSDTEYLDASALGMLLVADSEFRRSGRLLVLCCVQPGPRGVFEMTHVGGRLRIVAGVDDARRLLQ